jgi:hypothetical protein
MAEQTTEKLDFSETNRIALGRTIEALGIKTKEEAMLAGLILSADTTVIETEELKKDYEDFRFMAPYMQCKEKATGNLYTWHFCHSPRFYFGRILMYTGPAEEGATK